MTCWVGTISSLPVQPDRTTQDWLLRPYFLSQAFRLAVSGFNIRVLSQGLHAPSAEEELLFKAQGLSCREAFIREVYSQSEDKPLCLGRVVIPKKTYDLLADAIEQVGNTSIAERLLYSDPCHTRSAFEFAYTTYQPTGFVDVALSMPLFARRSMFTVKQERLWISEYFMRNLPSCPIDV